MYELQDYVRTKCLIDEYQCVMILIRSYYSDIFVQQLVEANNKENIKLSITGPLWVESIHDWWLPSQINSLRPSDAYMRR